MAYREYSPEELRQMQLEAAQRVREMQRQARERLEGSRRPSVSQQSETISPVSRPVEVPITESPRQQPHHTIRDTPSGLLGLSGLMGMDGDRLTILLLMLLLSSQGQCSPGLMAALFWLMADP